MEKVPVFVYVLCGERKLEPPYYLRTQDGIWEDELIEERQAKAKNKRLEIRCFQEHWVQARGGLDALEYDLGETCKWFARIGQIQLPSRKAGKLLVTAPMLKRLVDDWVASGSPREIGWLEKQSKIPWGRRGSACWDLQQNKTWKGGAMTVYDSQIEICINDPMEIFEQQYKKRFRELVAMRRLYPVRREGIADVVTDENALVDLLWDRTCVESERRGANGYVGSYHNCVFSLLYGIFAADIIAFLFDQAWVPATTIDPFRPRLFLQRLSVLEGTASELKDGTKMPVLLPETEPYVQLEMGPRLGSFSAKKHRLLLEYSLRELRDFGELGVSLQATNRKPTVGIHIYYSYEEYDPEILRFAKNKSEDSHRKPVTRRKTEKPRKRSSQ